MADGSWGNDPVQSMSSMDKADFSSLMDKTFGKGKWRLTGDYRSPAREDQLRREGAETVPPGHTSPHSEGTEDAPGAYDVVVDGMAPPMVAEKLQGSGVKFAKLFPEGASGTQGGHLHVQPYMTATGDAGDWGDDPIIKAKQTPLQIAQAGAKAWATPTQLAALAANERQRRPGYESPSAIWHARMDPAAAVLASDIKRAAAPAKGPVSETGAAEEALKLGTDIAGYVGGGLQTAIDFIGGRPVEYATKGKVSAQQAGDVENVATLAIPIVGEANLAARAKTAGVGARALLDNEAARAAAPRNTLPAASGAQPAAADSEHAAAVRRLKVAGVEPAVHQAAGGGVKRFVEALKSDYHTGPGIRAAEQQANDSFNRGLYNKVLAPIGERVLGKAPVGRQGVADVESRLDQAYRQVLPHIRLNADTRLTSDLADIRSSVAKLGRPQEQQFEAILNQDVLHHFGPGGMDGRTFKSVESDLLRQARNLKGSPDPNARDLGYALEDTLGALRADMERSSPPKWRARVRDVNESYAMFTRLQDAAARRQGGRGEITPGDLLAAVKRGDKSVRKGRFARGDALLQDFAEDADRVLTPEVRDSGTPERQAAIAAVRGVGGMAALGQATGVGPAIGAAMDVPLAMGTNALARRLLTRNAVGRVARAGPNYLKRVDQRVLAAPAPRRLP